MPERPAPERGINGQPKLKCSRILTDGNENENLSEVVEETVIDALITVSQGQGEIDMDDH